MTRLRPSKVSALISVVVTLTLGATLSGATAAHAESGDGHERAMALQTPAHAVAARTDRRPVAGGVYDAVARKTFISWGGVHEDNYVQAYDHRSGTWSAPVRIASGDDDSHNYPVMVLAPDGHLLVFHNLHNLQLIQERSAYPHSIEGTWTEQVIAEGNGATYPMPFVSGGAVFVFVRETVRDLDHKSPVDLRPMKYVRSTDSGLTWTNTAALTGYPYAIAPTDRPDNMNEIYIGQLRLIPGKGHQPDRVLIVYTLAGGGFEGHLHDRYHKNIYFTYFTPGDLHFHSADGRDLGTSVNDAEQEAYLKVADTAFTAPPVQRSPDYISLVGEVIHGVPFVVWMQYDPAGVLQDYTAVSTPLGWRVTPLGTGVRVRDMEPVLPFAWRVYATPDPATTGILSYLLMPGVGWKAGPTTATPTPVQRIEVITDAREPNRILATGASTARDVATADGDVYVAGFHRDDDDD
jgi:hypothetical protein